MQIPAIPENEIERLEALRALQVLDTPAEERFDRITRIAQTYFGVPIALVSLIDANRQWFKSRQGLDATETHRDISFCGHAILGEHEFSIQNTLEDLRFADNPLVTGAPDIRSYHGVPLSAPDGQKVGTLCLIDRVPRELSNTELVMLQDLAAMVESELAYTSVLQKAMQAEQGKARLGAVLDTIVDGVITIDKQGSIQALNPAATQIFGYQVDEVMGHNVNMLMPEPYHSEHDGYLLNFNNSGVAKIIGTGRQVKGRRKDGSVFPMELAVGEVNFGNERLFTGIVRDISERQTAEQELARFKATLDASLDCVFMFDPVNLLFCYVNSGAMEQLGYSYHELMRMSPVDIKPYIDEEQFSRMIQPLIDGPNRVLSLETVHRHRDGHDIPVDISLQYVHPDSDTPRFVAMVRDITERKRVENTLRNYSERLTLATRAGKIGVWDYDLVSGELNWDDRMFEIYGISRDSFPNTYEAWLQTLHPDDLARIEMELNEAATGKKPSDTEFRVVWPDGKVVYIKAAAEIVLDETGKVQRMTGVNTDISERKLVDRMKNEFVSTVSHELRTPLTSIMGSLGLMRKGVTGELPEAAQRMVDIAYNNSNRLVRMINDILDVEKIESGNMEFQKSPVNLVEIIRQALDANESYGLERGIKLVMPKLEPELRDIVVEGDVDRLTQLITNLLSNAAKFSPEGGQVTIDISRKENRVVVGVSDRGPGIPTEFRNRIFQRFSQADGADTKVKGGSGLGLNICKAIIEHHGGHISFEDRQKGGSRFFFELDLLTETNEAALGPFEHSNKQGRILVCEDDPDVANLVKMILQQAGYQVDVALNAAEAKSLLEGKEDYHAMTLDLGLPDQDGISLIRDLRENPKTRKLPIVVVSGSADKGRKELNGDAILMLDWITKPIDPQRLLQAVLNIPQEAKGGVNILHVEDDADVANVVREVLKDHGTILLAVNLSEARQFIKTQQFDLIILDMGLPDGSGEELIAELNSLSITPPPVIIFSAMETPANLIRQISAALLKSQASNQDLIDVVDKVIAQSRNEQANKVINDEIT